MARRRRGARSRGQTRLRAVGMALLLVLGVALPGWSYSDAAFSTGAGNPANSFGAAASFCSGTTASALYLTGYEPGSLSTSGLFASVTSGSGSSTAVDSAVKRNGAYSLKIVKASGTQSYVQKSFTATGVVTIRFALRVASLPGSDVLEFAGIEPSSGNEVWLGYDSSTQRFAVRWASNGVPGTEWVGDAGAAVTAGAWNLIEMKVDFSTNPRRLDWRVNSAAQTQRTYAQAASTALSIAIGSWQTSGGGYTANVDDLLILSGGTAYPPGDGKTIVLAPSGPGTHVNPTHFRNNGGSAIDANSYTRVDEIPVGSTSDNVYQTTMGVTSGLTFNLADTAESCFNAVEAVWLESATGSNNARTAVNVGATAQVLNNGHPYAGDLFYQVPVAAETAPWDATQVNGLYYGIGAWTTGNSPIWQALLAEVDVKTS